MKPSDLRRLAERNSWVFPAARVAQAIDGADQVHRSGEMPAWGRVFSSRDSAAEGTEKIDALTQYLEFIQARPPRR